jgi:hypothetical protein
MEDDFSVEKPRIARLTGPNYRPWAIQVQRLLLSHGLWDVVRLGTEVPVEGTKAKPASGDLTGGKSAEAGAGTTVGGASGSAAGTTESPVAPVLPGTDRTEVKDAKASTIIMGLCASGALQHILLLGTAKEQWEALRALYSPLGLQQLSAKIQAFTAYRPPESGATVAVVATELSTLQYEIGAIDPAETPSDTLKISILFQAIRALDSRFGPLILQLEISGTATDYSVIVAHLTEFERRMGPKEALKETVFRTRTLSTGRNRGIRNPGMGPGKEPGKGFQGRCFGCNQYGHREAQCPNRGQFTKRNPSTGPLMTPGGRRGLSPPPKQPEEASWMATTGPDDCENGLLWVVDSGCSRHMTFAREVFTEYRRLDSPIQVNTANRAQIQAIATGTVQLQVAIGSAVRTVALTDVLHVPRLAGSLILVLQLQDKGITVRTTVGPEGNRLLIEVQGVIVGVADRVGRSYTLNSTVQGQVTGHMALEASAASTDS